jgi:hypothetical protein
MRQLSTSRKAHRNLHLARSVQILARIIYCGTTFETADLSGPPTASGQDVIEESAMGTSSCRPNLAGEVTALGFHVYFHRRLHLSLNRVVVS